MTGPLRVIRSEDRIWRCVFTGLVAANAEPDDPGCPATLRVGGVDVLAALSAVAGGSGPAAEMVMHVNGRKLASGTCLEVNVGDGDDSACGDPGCCGGPERPRLAYTDPDRGPVDLLPLLSMLHGSDATIEVTVTAPVPPVVSAQLAHPKTIGTTTYQSGEWVTLPLPDMLRLAKATLVRDHAKEVCRLAGVPGPVDYPVFDALRGVTVATTKET